MIATRSQARGSSAGGRELGRHAREMTDLGEEERRRLMAIVFEVERAVRETMQPDKMNLASLGNQTVIAGNANDVLIGGAGQRR